MVVPSYSKSHASHDLSNIPIFADECQTITPSSLHLDWDKLQNSLSGRESSIFSQGNSIFDHSRIFSTDPSSLEDSFYREDEKKWLLFSDDLQDPALLDDLSESHWIDCVELGMKTTDLCDDGFAVGKNSEKIRQTLSESVRKCIVVKTTNKKSGRRPGRPKNKRMHRVQHEMKDSVLKPQAASPRVFRGLDKKSRPEMREFTRLPRSKTGCWTCRLRRKKCPEEKPHCSQCSRLQLRCDGYGIDKPAFMYEKNEQNKRLGEIKAVTSGSKRLLK